MKLYMPIWYGDRLYTECEIKRPTAGMIADTEQIVNDGHYAVAILNFVSNCIESLTTSTGDIETNREKIKLISREMKQKCLENLAIDIMILLDPNDGIEGVYFCPRCSTQIICEKKGEIDTRDFLSTFPVTYYDREVDYFEKALTNPYNRKEKGEIVETVNVIGFRYPSIQDLINNSAKYGFRDRMKLQYGIIADCIEKINGQAIDKAYRTRWCKDMISNIEVMADIRDITAEMGKYGREFEVEKYCHQCGKTWFTMINTSNFFVSGLRQEM